jgi:di/tricarboxylate transporter
MGPAGYTFKDYLVFGSPLSLLLASLAILLIPLFWPF